MTLSPWHFITLGIGGLLTTYALHKLWKTARHSADHHLLLKDIQKTVVPVDPNLNDPKNNGKLVFVVGKIFSGKKIGCPQFYQLEFPPVLKLKRIVEMYQWVEFNFPFNRVYIPKWHEGHIPSENFHDKDHKNPTTQLQTQTYITTHLKLGDYEISKGIFSGIPKLQNSQNELQNFHQEFHDPRPEFHDPRPEFQDPRPEFQDPRPEFQDPRPEFQDPRPEFQDPQPGFQNPRPEFQDPQPEFQDPQPESQDPRPEFQDTNFHLEFENFRPNNFHKTKDDWMYLVQEVVYDREAFEMLTQLETNNLTDVEKLKIVNSTPPIKKTRMVLRENEPEEPNIGDIRIKYQITKEEVVSIIAKQEDNKLVPFSSQKNKNISLVGRGEKSINELCQNHDTTFSMKNSFTNFFGTLMTIIGTYLMICPVMMVQKIVGDLLLCSTVLGVTLSAFVVGSTWLSSIFYWDRNWVHKSPGFD